MHGGWREGLTLHVTFSFYVEGNSLVSDMFAIFLNVMFEKYTPLIFILKWRQICSPFLNESGYRTSWLNRESNPCILSLLAQSLAVWQLVARLPGFWKGEFTYDLPVSGFICIILEGAAFVWSPPYSLGSLSVWSKMWCPQNALCSESSWVPRSGLQAAPWTHGYRYLFNLPN